MVKLLMLNLKHLDVEVRLVSNDNEYFNNLKIMTTQLLLASSSLATEWVKGKTLDEAGKLKNTDIAKELCLPPVKLHCSSKMIRLN